MPEQELGPVQVERDGGDRRRHPLGAQGGEGPLRALDLLGGSVSGVVDQLRWRGPRAPDLPAPPQERSPGARSHPPRSRRSSRGHRGGVLPRRAGRRRWHRGLARDLPRAIDVASREERLGLAEPSARQLLLADRRSQPLRCRIELGRCLRCASSCRQRSAPSSSAAIPHPVLSCRAPGGEPALRDPTPQARDACAVAAAVPPRLSRRSPTRGVGARSESGHPSGQHPASSASRSAAPKSASAEAPRQGRTGSAARWRPRRARAAVRAATRSGSARPPAPRGCGGRAKAASASDRRVVRAREPSRGA